MARIFVADHYSPFRDVVRLMMADLSEQQVVGEAADDLTAVQNIKELRPDLVLLDVDLPKAGGLEVARQIREIAPETKIVFLSPHHSATLVREAFSTGASGYVLKWKAARELVSALQAVLSNQLFLSENVARHNLTVPRACRLHPKRP